VIFKNLKKPIVERAISNYKKEIVPLIRNTQLFRDKELKLKEMVEIGGVLQYAEVK
jgi:activator of 2-hydroxyglutaryl-CoA dehydratase